MMRYLFISYLTLSSILAGCTFSIGIGVNSKTDKEDELTKEESVIANELKDKHQVNCHNYFIPPLIPIPEPLSFTDAQRRDKAYVEEALSRHIFELRKVIRQNAILIHNARIDWEKKCKV